MKLPSLKKLNALGFSHIIVPLIAIVIIGGIGSYVAVKSKSHAATPPTPSFCAANGMAYYNGQCVPTVPNYHYKYYGTKNGVADYACTLRGYVYAKYVVSSVSSTRKYLLDETFNNGAYDHIAYLANTKTGNFYLHVVIPTVGRGYNPAYTQATFGATYNTVGMATTDGHGADISAMSHCY